MKNLRIKLVLIGAAILVSAQSFSQSILDSGAVIVFEKEIHDFGEIEFDADGRCVFVFTNTGNEPLIISEAKKSCGCTIPSWSKEPIAPGETGRIDVKYDTKRVGNFAKSVTIKSNAINTPVHVIKIKGTVLPKAESGIPFNNVGPMISASNQNLLISSL